MQEPYGKGASDSILASSFAEQIVRCVSKRKPEESVGGVIELRKAGRTGCRLPSEMEQGNTAAALFASGRPVLRSLRARARQENNMHREPGDLQCAFGKMRRPVREGQKPYDGHARAREVGLRRNTDEPAEQRKVTSCGEGRAQLEENFVGTHMLLTRAGISMFQCSAVCVGKLQSSLPHAMILRRAVCVDALVRICAGGGS